MQKLWLTFEDDALTSYDKNLISKSQVSQLSISIGLMLVLSWVESRVKESRTASLGEKNSKRKRELENFESLGPRVCEVLL